MRSIIVVLVLSWAATARATMVSTDFEFDASGAFAIGPVGQRAFFSGGLVAEPDPPIVPTSGTHVWLIGPGETGVIDFESFTRPVTLNARRSTVGWNALIVAYAPNLYEPGQAYYLAAPGAGWSILTIDDDFTETGRLVLQNYGTQEGQWLAVDDLSYVGSDRLVPEPSGLDLAIAALVLGVMIALWRRRWHVRHCGV